MKRWVWPLLFVLVTLWAGFATWQWRQAVVSAQSPRTSPVLASEGVADLERAGFLRQFADQYFNYDETSYWRNQTALAFLMVPELRDKKLAELADQRDRKRAAGFRQSSQLAAILRKPDGVHELHGFLEGREDERVWKLNYTATLGLKEIPRTLENPWGLEIEALEIQTSPMAPSSEVLSIALEAQRPATVIFPCYVESVENGSALPLKIRITSLRTSELQLIRTGDFATSSPLIAHCKDRKFLMTVNAATQLSHLFLQAFEAQGQVPVVAAVPSLPRAKKKPKEAYQKTLEDELGFVIDE